jgi:hypothetical protein
MTAQRLDIPDVEVNQLLPDRRPSSNQRPWFRRNGHLYRSAALFSASLDLRGVRQDSFIGGVLAENDGFGLSRNFLPDPFCGERPGSEHFQNI